MSHWALTALRKELVCFHIHRWVRLRDEALALNTHHAHADTLIPYLTLRSQQTTNCDDAKRGEREREEKRDVIAGIDAE